MEPTHSSTGEKQGLEAGASACPAGAGGRNRTALQPGGHPRTTSVGKPSGGLQVGPLGGVTWSRDCLAWMGFLWSQWRLARPPSADDHSSQVPAHGTWSGHAARSSQRSGICPRESSPLPRSRLRASWPCLGLNLHISGRGRHSSWHCSLSDPFATLLEYPQGHAWRDAALSADAPGLSHLQGPPVSVDLGRGAACSPWGRVLYLPAGR